MNGGDENHSQSLKKSIMVYDMHILIDKTIEIL